MADNIVAGVKYQKAEAGYFEKRTLKRSAGFWGIWGLGVAAVISGEFSGWNLGTDTAGFGGMAIAVVIVIVTVSYTHLTLPTSRRLRTTS